MIELMLLAPLVLVCIFTQLAKLFNSAKRSEVSDPAPVDPTLHAKHTILEASRRYPHKIEFVWWTQYLPQATSRIEYTQLLESVISELKGIEGLQIDFTVHDVRRVDGGFTIHFTRRLPSKEEA